MRPVRSDDPGANNGTIPDHRFIAANTALAVANQDSTHLELTLDFLQDGHLTVDIFGLVPITEEDLPQALTSVEDARIQAATSFAIGEEEGMQRPVSFSSEARQVVGSLTDGSNVIRAGQTYRLDVVVRSRSIGHFFPTGTTDAQEAWLEVIIQDGSGNILLESGTVTEHVVDSTAHFYRNVLVDEAGNRIDKRNAFAARSAVYVNLIPPGGADVAHYVVSVPENVVAPLEITARLNYRKFSEDFTRFAFGGEFEEPFDSVNSHFSTDRRSWTYEGPHDDVSSTIESLPRLPIAVMAEDRLRLERERTSTEAPTGQDYLRWNDYGISLLREGDLATARYAFEQVTELDSTYADGWLNLARAHLLQGSFAQAITALQLAEKNHPGYYKTAYFRGLASKELGQYDQAIMEFNTVLQSHPNDRVVLNDLGRSYYLNEQMTESARAFEDVLRIDSEDITAHYNLMLVYEASGDRERSNLHRTRYERFKSDESAGALARSYRARHPWDNNEAIPVHMHY